MVTIKYLCICDYGQVRSGAMAWYIHGLNRDDGRINNLQYEAIAIGAVTSSKKTMKMMKAWADVVIDVRKYIPSDVYGTPTHPELMDKVQKIWELINLKHEHICEDCGKELTTNEEINEHASKNKHYKYKVKGTEMYLYLV